MSALEAFAPQLLAAVRAAHASGEQRGDSLHLGADFRAAPKISIDYAVMEKTDHAAVVPVDYAWSDLGSWQAIYEASARDSQQNAVQGPAATHASRGCLARSTTGQLAAIIGLDRVGVVVEPGAVLVCALDSSQEVKTLVDQLKASSSSLNPTAGALRSQTSRLTDWLFGSALPIWWSLGADHRRGGFREALDQNGAPVDDTRRLRVQARQVYAYATAGALGWRGPWRNVILHGLDYLEARYRRDDGLYRTLVTADGTVVDAAALLYDQAFVLLALAAAAQALPQDRARRATQAEALLGRIREAYACPAGGLRETNDERPYQSNALMHLFEAALTWSQVSDHPGWLSLANEIGELCCARLIDPASGALREVFDSQWRPAPGELGRIVEPGHQFEWCWLLQQWSQLEDRGDAAAKARRLFEIGELSVDLASGAALDSLFDDFSVREPTARLWPQTERVKAAHLLGEEAVCLKAAKVMEAYFQTPMPGLWRDRIESGSQFGEGPAPRARFTTSSQP